WSAADFSKKAPGLDWNAFFDAAGLSNAKQFDVWQPSAFTGLSKLTLSESLDAWKALLTFHAGRKRAAAAEGVRRFALRFLRQDLAGHTAAARALEARSVGDEHRSRRCGRADLRAEIFSGFQQGRSGSTGQESADRIRSGHRQARLDVAADQGEG